MEKMKSVPNCRKWRESWTTSVQYFYIFITFSAPSGDVELLDAPLELPLPLPVLSV